MTTPVPPTSIGFCLVHGRTGLGSRSTLVTLTIESSGRAARVTVATPASVAIARLNPKPIRLALICHTSHQIRFVFATEPVPVPVSDTQLCLKSYPSPAGGRNSEGRGSARTSGQEARAAPHPHGRRRP